MVRPFRSTPRSTLPVDPSFDPSDRPLIRPFRSTPLSTLLSTLSLFLLTSDGCSCHMSEQRRQQQPRRPRPSRSEREQRRISTQVNQLANRLLQVNQDFLNLARTQLEAFNSLQQESRNSYTSPQEPLPSRSRSPSPPRAAASYRQRPSLLSSGIRTPPTPRQPSSSPEPPREDSETLPDSSEQHSCTPSVIGWDSYIAENGQTRQTTDRYVPEYTERTQLLARHPHAPDRPRQ